MVGYFIQGFFKFGGVELIKVKATEALGTKKVRVCVCVFFCVFLSRVRCRS